MSAGPVLRLEGITRRFGTLLANDDISLSLHAGEVLALLGENGAGKSTLVSILFGHYLADAGSVVAFGRPLAAGDTRAALAAGIGMVHQHFALAENLTVLENVMLGLEPLWRLNSRRHAVRERLLRAGQDFGLLVDPAAQVSELSVGERQRVEILKALVRGSRILVLDEPTAILSPQESESLFETLRKFTDAGLALIFISHKLDEVLRVSHNIVVLKHGRCVLRTPAGATSKQALAEAMVGSLDRAGTAGTSNATNATNASNATNATNAANAAPAPKAPSTATTATTAIAGTAAAEPRIELDGVSVARGGHASLHAVDLQVLAGEVLAIAGVSGNGQQTLAALLSGELAPQAGQVRISGRLLPAGARHWIDAGIARIPEDRTGTGVIGDASIEDNAMAHRLRDPLALRRGWLGRRLGLLDRAGIRAEARRIVDAYDVRHASLDQPIRMLSGGNIQKFILGRELGQAPRVIIANQPTWGLDIGAVAFVHRQLLTARSRGAAVLLISEDLEEILAIADRMAVIFGGRLTPARPLSDWDAAGIGLAMAGGASAS